MSAAPASGLAAAVLAGVGSHSLAYSNVRAFWIRGLASFSWSFVALVFALAGGVERPFLMVSGIGFALGLGGLAYVLVFMPELAWRRSVWRLVFRRALSARFSWPLWASFLVGLELCFFGLSGRYVDLLVTSVFYEMGPVLAILMLGFALPGRFRRSLRSLVPLVGICFVSLFLVALSEEGGLAMESGSFLGRATGVSLGWTPALGFGILFALTGAVCSSVAVLGFRWARSLAPALAFLVSSPARQPWLEVSVVAYPDWDVSAMAAFSYRLILFGTVVAFVLMGLVSGSVNLLLAALLGEFSGLRGAGLGPFSFLVSPPFVWGFLAAGACCVVGSILFRWAMLQTDQPGINLWGYSVPLWNILWFYLFFEITVARLDWLLLGAVGMALVGALLNLEGRGHRSRSALLGFLWFCGLVVLFGIPGGLG